MGVTLVTGGPGFIGSHVTRALLERGDDVRVTVRKRSRPDNLAGLEVERVECDLLDRRQVRRALAGVEKLFHCAGLTSLRAGADTHFRVNVQGTRILLEEALAAGVQRVIHTSSFAAVGPATGTSRTADEAQHFRAGRLGLPYVNAMREAEAMKLKSVALVGMSCQASINGTVNARGLNKYANRIALTIGLLCSKTFTYDGMFAGALVEEHGIPLETINKVNIKGKLSLIHI